MKKSVLKIAAIFMALLTIHLQTFATSAGTTSSENDVVVNYDETEIYASFEEMTIWLTTCRKTTLRMPTLKTTTARLLKT